MAVDGVDLVINNIKAFGGGFVKHVNTTMSKLAKGLHKVVKRNISWHDHSLADLAALDHPYAKRHGDIYLHHPPYLVHTQSGQLLSSLFEKTEDAVFAFGRLDASAIVGNDTSVAPHAQDVIFGTSVMLPRDYLEGSLQEYLPEAKGVLEKNLRDAVTNFTPKGTV